MSATLDALRRWGVGELAAAGIDTAALDARLLLQHATGLAHEDLVAEPGRMVADAPFRALIARRAAREPVSRITGEREFYGRVFRVTQATLDPRADTETLIGEALREDFISVLDLGTGTGAIAVTLLAERPDARAIATDISQAALAVAADNARAHAVADRLTLCHGSWFEPVGGVFDLIVSNPPYIPLGAIPSLQPEVRDHDPARSLDGGPDGLEAYRRIAAGAAPRLASGGRILLEIGAAQSRDVTNIMESEGYRSGTAVKDLGGHVRVLTFRSPNL